jgi:hypothetical protein
VSVGDAVTDTAIHGTCEDGSIHWDPANDVREIPASSCFAAKLDFVGDLE